jgi:protein-S-isoprenylcysteine O-methyltransferase Ste14
VISAHFIGTVSLLGLALFLFIGPFALIDLDLEPVTILVFDGLLCLGFFLQHSGMIRKSFRNKLVKVVPEHYYGAFYTLTSSVALLVLLVCWQQSPQTVVSLQGGLRLLTRLVFFAGIAGFIWGVRSLAHFDAFGLKPIRARLRGSEVRAVPLAIRGPYRWVRHPLYFFALLLIWAFPELTLDRLLFNVLMTGWIVIGTYLEERDLVDEFGESYLEYQRTVPMLIPWTREVGNK